MGKTSKNSEQNAQDGEESLVDQIFALGTKYFYISRSDISFSSDPGKIITELVRDQWLLPYGRGRYLFGKRSVESYLGNHEWLYQSILCLETAVWLHNLIDITPFPLRAAVPETIQAPVQRAFEVEVYRASDWPQLDFEVEPLAYFEHSLRIYTRERTIVDLLRCDIDGRRKTLAEEMISTWWEKGKLEPIKLEFVAEKMDALNMLSPYIATLKKRRRRAKAKLP